MSDFLEVLGLIDRACFDDGPWDEEPDLLIWRDDKSGIICAVSRTRNIGSLCGYCAVPEGHDLRGADNYWCDPVTAIDVHGGITFLGNTPYTSYGAEIASIVEQIIGEKHDFWVGFDCAHSGDLSPRDLELGNELQYPYRSIKYVKSQTVLMARQIEGGER